MGLEYFPTLTPEIRPKYSMSKHNPYMECLEWIQNKQLENHHSALVLLGSLTPDRD